MPAPPGALGAPGVPPVMSIQTEDNNRTEENRASQNEEAPLMNQPSRSMTHREVDQQMSSNTEATLHHQETTEAQKPHEWKSKLLRLPVLVLTMLIALLLATGIIGLLIVSIKNHGITTVNMGNGNGLFKGTPFVLRISLAWTFVPVLIFQLYILLVGAIVQAAGARQPYIELVEGASAQKSICLDYTAELAIKKPLIALRLKHFMLAYSFALTIFVSVVLTALTSHLMDTSNNPVSRPRRVDQTLEFSLLSVPAQSDLYTLLDIAAATRIYGGSPIPWTTLSHSILPVDLTGVPKSSNFSMNATSYNTGIDCKVLSSPSEFELLQTTNGWQFETVDDGCNYQSSPLDPFTLDLVPDIVQYVHTYSNLSCPASANYSRIIVVAALNANNSESVLTNKTALSCSMAYYSTNGSLSLSTEHSTLSNPIINEFLPTGSTLLDPKPAFGFDIERLINIGFTVDPTSTVQSNTFGRAILEYAQSLSPQSYFDGNILQRATQELYATSFAILANKFLLENTASHEVLGYLNSIETRLVVVPVVAYLIIVILAAIEVMIIWICIYTQTNDSTLYEEPKGLLGAAAILRNSDLLERVKDIGSSSGDGKVAAVFNRMDTGDEWIYTSWESPNNARLLSNKAPD